MHFTNQGTFTRSLANLLLQAMSNIQQYDAPYRLEMLNGWTVTVSKYNNKGPATAEMADCGVATADEFFIDPNMRQKQTFIIPVIGHSFSTGSTQRPYGNRHSTNFLSPTSISSEVCLSVDGFKPHLIRSSC